MDTTILIQSLLKGDSPHKVLQLLEVSQQLLLKYGKKLMLPSFLQGIKDLYPDLEALIRILHRIGVMKNRELADFIRAYKAELPQNELYFRLEANDEEIVQPLQQYLEKRFGKVVLDFQALTTPNLTVRMKGNGYAFKRSLDADIDKLLV